MSKVVTLDRNYTESELRGIPLVTERDYDILPTLEEIWEPVEGIEIYAFLGQRGVSVRLKPTVVKEWPDGDVLYQIPGSQFPFYYFDNLVGFAYLSVV